MRTEALYHIFKQCTGVTTDSRHCPEGSMFIALRGGNFDGNAFAAQALKAGCACAVVDDPAVVPAGDSRYVLVDNGLEALQQLARHHRRQRTIPVIGITGTNGKTTTKELTAAVLSRHYKTLYTEGNLNNHIGVPLTLLRLKAEHQLAIIEMGASHPGDIRLLAGIAEPDYGIVTNIGKAHLEGFGSLAGVIKTKGELFDFLRTREEGTAFVWNDLAILSQMAQGLKRVSYGTCNGLYIEGRVRSCSPFLSVEWSGAGEERVHEVQTLLIGDYNLPNVLAAIAIGRYFGVKSDEVNAALAAYEPHNSRSQLLHTDSNTLIVDAYNANPTSMRAAIDNFRRLDAPHKMLILGDMGELGADSEEEHRRIAEHVKECGFEEVRLVGSRFAAVAHDWPTYANAEVLAEALRQDKPQGRTILIKGSNNMRLSTLVPWL